MAQTALVTGASSGLGREFARLAAADGMDLVLVARRRDRLEELAAELATAYGVQVTCVDVDLSTPEGRARLVDATEQAHLHVDVLVNNAGFGDCADLAEADLDKLDQMIDLNVRALTDLTYYYLGGMLDARGGAILNVASVAAFEPGPGMGTYFATKAYVLSLTEALAEELRGTGVTATALCPGTTGTAFWDVAEAGSLSLLRQINLADPSQVAAYGWESMRRGRVVAVPGIANKLSTGSVRLLPRALVRRVMRRLLAKADR